MNYKIYIFTNKKSTFFPFESEGVAILFSPLVPIYVHVPRNPDIEEVLMHCFRDPT